MIVQSIDLAAVYSCALVTGDGGEVIDEYVSFWQPRVKTVNHLTRYPAGLPEWIAVEEQPHGVRWDSTTKSVARLQGELINRWREVGVLDRVAFVPPQTWQTASCFKVAGKSLVWKQGPEGAAYAAKMILKYEPPNLLEQYKALYEYLHGDEVNQFGQTRTKVREMLKKVMTDMVDARLIDYWARLTIEAKGTLFVGAVQPYKDI